MKKKVIALTLAVLMLVSIMPTVTAESAENAGEAVVTSAISADNSVLTLEAYVTGSTVSAEEAYTAPADIVLVLDQSASMGNKYDSRGSCQQALKQAVAAFVESVGESYSEFSNHRISVVSFGTVAIPVVGWTEADAAGVAAIEKKIDALSDSPAGASNMDLGLKTARMMLNMRDGTSYEINGSVCERKTVVVLFTDGYPGASNAKGDYFSNLYDTPNAADRAVAAAAKLKEDGVAVYTVGAFANADPAANYNTQKKSAIWTVWRSAAKSQNGLMHFISGDYDSSCVSWRDNTVSNDGRNCGYYIAAHNTAALVSAFESIAGSAIITDNVVGLDNTAVLSCTLSDYFDIDGNVTAYTAAYNAADGSFGEEDACNCNIDVDGKTVTVSGFDYSAHYCAAGAPDGMKLVVKIPIADNVKEYGSYAVTESSSGIYGAQGAVAYAPAVSTNVANLVDLGDNSTSIPDVEKYFLDTFGDSSYFENLWPTMSSLRTLGDNIYLLDYQYDYDIDDLMETGVSSAAELLAYASTHILGGAFEFKMGEWGTGCSAYEAYNEDGDHIMGRNFDYMDAPCYVVWTHPEDGYASVSMVDGTFMLTTDHLSPTSTMGRFQSLLSPYLCLDGMNETGFAISVLQIHADGTKQDTGKTDMFTTAMIRCCLDKCASVNEAIELFKSFDVQDTIALGYSLGCCFHYMLTDASGDAAVIEYVNNEIRVIRADDPEYQRLFVTNFYLSEDGGVGSDAYDPEGMERYEIIKSTLAENNNVLSFDEAFNLLSDVHLNYRHDNNLYDITTLWSCIYNNTQGTMALAARMDYSSIYTFNVTNPMRVYSIDSVEVTTPIEGIGLH